jgi:hypothetical protein
MTREKLTRGGNNISLFEFGVVRALQPISEMTSIREVKKLLACAGLTLCLVAYSQAQGWRGIRPLHSTRQDVERLIGPPLQPNGMTYDLKGERVNVVYSANSCSRGWPYGWNVPPGTVTGITIYPQPRPKLAELPIDVTKATKYVDPSGFIHFNNNEAGLSVEVDPENMP